MIVNALAADSPPRLAGLPAGLEQGVLGPLSGFRARALKSRFQDCGAPLYCRPFGLLVDRQRRSIAASIAISSKGPFIALRSAVQ
jgi:hypothetical protein